VVGRREQLLKLLTARAVVDHVQRVVQAFVRWRRAVTLRALSGSIQSARTMAEAMRVLRRSAIASSSMLSAEAINLGPPSRT
jgi:hypothetical protein